MKKTIFVLAAMAVVSLNSLVAAEVSAKDKASWGNFVSGKTTAERWTNIAKIAPNLLGMTRAEVEKVLGKGTYSEKQDELMYLITDDGSKYKVFDNIIISFGKDSKVKSFVIITKAND
jgi:outer membrane protein assembly factor BamE (lipoprotein component of BamABCDE complex)